MPSFVWINRTGKFLIVSEHLTHVGRRPFGSFTNDLNHASVMKQLPEMIDFNPAGNHSKGELLPLPASVERTVLIGAPTAVPVPPVQQPAPVCSNLADAERYRKLRAAMIQLHGLPRQGAFELHQFIGQLRAFSHEDLDAQVDKLVDYREATAPQQPSRDSLQP